jgi:hypothetical protein
MNEKLLVGIGVGAACIGILVSTAVHAQNVSASKSPSARASAKTTGSKDNQPKQQPTQSTKNIADTLDRHCGNCNHLAMFSYEQDREPVYTRIKNADDIEFEARIRQNFLDNYLAGNIRGPFHQNAGVCICGHPHDLGTQIEVNKLATEYMIRFLDSSIKAHERNGESGSNAAIMDKLYKRKYERKKSNKDFYTFD